MSSTFSTRRRARAVAIGVAIALAALGAAPSIAATPPRARAAGSLLFNGRTDQCPPDLPRCGRVSIRMASDLSSIRFFLEWEARCHPNNKERNLRETHKFIAVPVTVSGSGSGLRGSFSFDWRNQALFKSKPGAPVPLELHVDQHIQFNGRIRINQGTGRGEFRGRVNLVQRTPGQVLKRTCTPEGQKVIHFKVKRA